MTKKHYWALRKDGKFYLDYDKTPVIWSLRKSANLVATCRSEAHGYTPVKVTVEVVDD